MSARSTIATLSGALVLTFGAVAFAAPATAIPPVAPSAPTAPGDYPLNGQGAPQTSPQQHTEPEKNEQAEKAEKLGGGLAAEVIDLFAGVIKCGLNIATDAVPCGL